MSNNKKFYLVFFWILLFISLDLGVGFLYHQVVAHSNRLRIKSTHYHHDLRPNFSGIDQWGQFNQPYFTNSLGFRDRKNKAISFGKGSAHRVVFIGDSFAEGVGVTFDSSFVGRVEQQFANSAIEVLNAGVVTYSPKLYYLKMKYLIEQKGLQLDDLFVVIDNADVQDEIVYEGWAPGFWHYSTTLSLIEKWQIRMKKISSPTITWDEEQYYVEREKWLYEPAIMQKWGQHGLSLSVEYLQKLKELCNLHGIRMGIIIFPRPEQIKRGLLSDSFTTTWEKFCKANAIKLISLYPAFIQPNGSTQVDSVVKHYFIPGDVHWNDKGNEKVAAAFLAQYQ